MGKKKGAAASKKASTVKPSSTFSKNVGVSRPLQQAKSSAGSLFDTKVNKTKFDILNKHVIGAKGNPTKSKTRSLEIRKNSLLPEMARRGRISEFTDRRFGERNSALSTEEKMLERFSRERVKTNKKKDTFNLNGGDDNNNKDYGNEDFSNTLKLTHRGRTINDEEGFDSEPEGSDFDSDGGLDGDIVSFGHFGSGNADPNDPNRTKAEIMNEVIAKSKMHKHERQKIKEENAALCDYLDADFGSIMNALETRDGFHERQEARKTEKEDDYMSSLNQMAFDRRVRPSDRTKTPEELKKDAEEKKKKDDKERKQRMQGDDLNDEFAASDSDADESSTRKQKGGEDKIETEAERSIRRVMNQVEQHLDNMLNSTTLNGLNLAYSELAKLSRTNSVIPVARVIRERLGLITESISKLMEKDSAPLMPNRETLMIFHFIGKIFSSSDLHHIVVTPATLLINAYMAHGRMTKRKHLISALFLIQTLLNYQAISKRFSPELVALLHPILYLASGIPESDLGTCLYYPKERFMSKSVHGFLQSPRTLSENIVPRAIGFEDIVKVEEDEDYLSKDLIMSFLLNIVNSLTATYKDNAAAPEIIQPFLNILEKAGIPSPDLSTFKNASRKPLMFQTFKPISIPQFNLELDDGPSRDEREQQMLKRSYKREFKGAKRELKRDSAFLAQEKATMRVEADRKYQERQRQILGSISNEGNEPKRGRNRR